MTKLLAALWGNIIAPVLAYLLDLANTLMAKVVYLADWAVANPFYAFVLPLVLAGILAAVTRLENSRRRS